MPELPEVETTLRGLQPHLQRQMITNVVVRHYGLRWPIPHDIKQNLHNKIVYKLERRAKYLLLKIDSGGAVIIHLGMSGHLRLLKHYLPPQAYDHVDIEFANHLILRFTDPRRFGAFLWTDADPQLHPLLKNLGPEPLDLNFSGEYLCRLAQRKTVGIKTFIMDSKNVVGIGNIYANEALFIAGIHPSQPVNKISAEQFKKLEQAIKEVLQLAINRGGTTLKDFFNSEGKAGYFSNELNVYGRNGLPCVRCATRLTLMQIAQRSTVFCAQCQPMQFVTQQTLF